MFYHFETALINRVKSDQNLIKLEVKNLKKRLKLVKFGSIIDQNTLIWSLIASDTFIWVNPHYN